jgi:hypothetical protein
MRKIRFFGKKTVIAVGLCIGLAGYLFVSQKPSVAADSESDMADTVISYVACSDNNEDILYEDVDETISMKVIDLEEQGLDYEVSDAIELDQAYYHRIEKADGESIVAGITAGGQNYVVTMESNASISDAEVEEAIANLQEELK